MATILLSAAGASLGGFFGGGAFGLSSAVIGRAVGATVGRLIDQKLMGGGSEVVETARMDRLRIMGANEGGGIPRILGRMRVAGNVIWASDFREYISYSGGGGGKGAPKPPVTKSYSYTVSLAIGLCEGEIARVGRVWADGAEVSKDDLNMRVYHGGEDQQPDPTMEAIEGDGNVPAYRGLAYVVLENLPLSKFGNRVPQLSFEVVRRASHPAMGGLDETVKAVALMPGSGEHALAAEPIYVRDANGLSRAANLNSAQGKTDLEASLEALNGELPNCSATSLVVSWFGTDLRAGECRVLPKVETSASGGAALGSAPAQSAASGSWSVSGIGRQSAEVVARIDNRPVYGGTPSDASVVSSIKALGRAGQEVMFYPFVLMEVLPDNQLPNPWTGELGQDAFPWRGRITAERAPGVIGTPDQTSLLNAEIEAFMGTAQVSDFSVQGASVAYSGGSGWGYRRFILHYASLCKAAGGVDAFCIGSELRGLTQLRDETGAFPMVAALVQLARDVRSILGPDTKIGYAADWSEYFGYHPSDGSGDVLFHLDPLWADQDIDFVGIDNYMPISDWRDGDDHLDKSAGSIYDLDYLKSNIRGGEGFDWFYRDTEKRNLQLRDEIRDDAYGEPWIYRYKDFWNWWSQPHHDRISGVRQSSPTAWVPQSKPFWFTELGCAAIDKGTNEPNKFLDPKSSESALPRFSNGQRDDFMQMQYLRAYSELFEDPDWNPVSSVYGASMVDADRMYVWAWDARPWPEFPNALNVWSDGENHQRGHWLTGRSASVRLSDAVRDICKIAGVSDVDVSNLYGTVRGFSLPDVETARASLQQLMLTYGFDAIEDEGQLLFQSRGMSDATQVELDSLVIGDDRDTVIETVRAPVAEVTGQVRLNYTDADGSFADRVAEARFPGDDSADLTQSDVSLALTAQEARGVAERWLAEARIARDSVKFELPPSRNDVRAGSVLRIPDEKGAETRYRVDRVDAAGARKVEAVRVERQIYTPSDSVEALPSVRPFTVPIPISAQFMDLPLLRGTEVPHAPHIAALAQPWPGGAAVYGSSVDADYQLNTVVEAPATMGVTVSPLPAAQVGLWQRGPRLRVELARGQLSAASQQAVFAGANTAAIGDGSSGNWEIVQFQDAQMIGDQTFELSGFLRGQAGSDGLMPDVWPIGSRFVLLDGTLQQIELEASMRGLARHYRIGPAQRPVDDPSFQYYLEAFSGIGLKPYGPAHLKATRTGADLVITWVRRTRIDGDNWSSFEVPLGEDAELYLLRVLNAGAVVREVSLDQSEWTYSAALQAADGFGSGSTIEVAQISSRFGPGYFSRIETDG